MAISGILTSQNHYNQRASGLWPTSVYVVVVAAATQRAIFGYGSTGGSSVLSITNLVSTTGVVATNTTGVGTARWKLAAAAYGVDKAIFGYGTDTNYSQLSITNLVSNTGVVANDTTGVGSVRANLAAAGYGTDKAIFGHGELGAPTYAYTSVTNLVSNLGIVATDTAGVGTSRGYLAAAGYGTDKAIFGYGLQNSGAPSYIETTYSSTNKVSNTGVVASDTTGVGTARYMLAAAAYGTDKAIFGYGFIPAVGNASLTNLVSNTGVVASDTTGVGTARQGPSAAGYGGDKAIFGYGNSNAGNVSVTNLVSNTGVVASDTTGVGTSRTQSAAAGF